MMQSSAFLSKETRYGSDACAELFDTPSIGDVTGIVQLSLSSVIYIAP